MKKLIPLFIIGALSIHARAQNPYPLVPIDSIQYVNPQKLGNNISTPDYINPVMKNPVYKDTVQLEGYVTFNPSSYGLSTSRSRYGTFLQTGTGGPWSGVHVLLNKDIYPGDSVNGLDNVVKYFATFLPGQKVRATAVIGDFQGMTQLNLLKIKSIALPDPPLTVAPQLVTIEEFMKNDGSGTQVQQLTTGEQWEGVYVEFRDVTVVDVSTANGGIRYFWSLQDANGNRIRVQDVSGYYRNDDFDRDANTPRNPAFMPPPIGTTLSYVRGVITETTGNYNIAPLTISDLGPVTFSAPIIGQPWRAPVIASSSDSVYVFSKIKDDSAMATVTLNYAPGISGGSFTQIVMDSISGTFDADGKRLLTYKGVIPPFADGTYVRYWIQATDNFGHHANFPDSLASGSVYRVVNNFNSIRLIQETPYAGGGSVWVNDTLKNIVIGGIVTSTTASNDLGLATIQSGTAPNSGIFVFAKTGDGVENWQRGDSVRITSAVVTEKAGAGFATYVKAGTTFLENLGGNHTVVSSGNPLPAPVELDVDSFIKVPPVTPYSEQWEGMLIEFDSVYVVNRNPDAPSTFGEFSIRRSQVLTTGLRVDDYSNAIGQEYGADSLADFQFLHYIRGIMGYAFGTWKLYPRNKADIDRTNNPDLEEPVITILGANPLTVPKGATYSDPGATAFDNKDGDITANIDTTSDVNTSIEGTYSVCYDVTDMAGNAAKQVCRFVIVGPNSVIPVFNNRTLNIFPVPAKNDLNITFELTNSATLQLSVSDMSGKVYQSSELIFTAGAHTYTLDARELPAGIYICSMKGNNVSMLGRIVVIK